MLNSDFNLKGRMKDISFLKMQFLLIIYESYFS